MCVNLSMWNGVGTNLIRAQSAMQCRLQDRHFEDRAMNLIQKLLFLLVPRIRAKRIDAFDEMDFEIQRAWCRRCRRPLEFAGEGPRTFLWRSRYRACRLRCPRCHRVKLMRFDISAALRRGSKNSLVLRSGMHA